MGWIAQHLGHTAAVLALIGMLAAAAVLGSQAERLLAAHDQRAFLLDRAADVQVAQRGLLLRELRYTAPAPDGRQQLQRRLAFRGWARERHGDPGAGVYYPRTRLWGGVVEIAYVRWEPATRTLQIGSAICITDLGCP